jgi:hypothetical protein
MRSAAATAPPGLCLATPPAAAAAGGGSPDREGLKVAGGGAPVRPGVAARGRGRETGSGEDTCVHFIQWEKFSINFLTKYKLYDIKLFVFKEFFNIIML